MLTHAALDAHLLLRLNQVREQLGLESIVADASVRFADALDSMGFVEFLAVVADDCGVTVEAIEQSARHHFGTIGAMAAALDVAGLHPRENTPGTIAAGSTQILSALPKAWLAATRFHVPIRLQPAAAMNALLDRPGGWLEEHAGIHGRRVWDDEDVLDAAARTATDCVSQAGLPSAAPGALLVTSEAPPVLGGLAAALHQRLGLSSDVPALEIGGACTGFLAALWIALRLLADTAAVLVAAVEAPSRWLAVHPGRAGEAAALFGDGTAACVLTSCPTNSTALPLRDVFLGTDGQAGSLLHVQHEPGRGVTLHMDGPPLALRAVRTMADAVRRMSERHGLSVEDLTAVVAHGGNGRLPALLARRLGLPVERVWSETARAGNLGSASLPIAWAAHAAPIQRPAIWTAAGAGLQWGAALFDPAEQRSSGASC